MTGKKQCNDLVIFQDPVILSPCLSTDLSFALADKVVVVDVIREVAFLLQVTHKGLGGKGQFMVSFWEDVRCSK